MGEYLYVRGISKKKTEFASWDGVLEIPMTPIEFHLGRRIYKKEERGAGGGIGTILEVEVG